VNPRALIDRNGRKVAYLIREEKVIETPVRTGQMVGGVVEITEGLTSGDQVVLNPSADLKNGMKIKVGS
jgi:multidrug efflux pump subunit AcrA (membrane-fusion protein)